MFPGVGKNNNTHLKGYPNLRSGDITGSVSALHFTWNLLYEESSQVVANANIARN